MLGSFLLIGGILLGQGESASDESLRVEVRRLVRQLDAAQLAERDAAEEKLFKLGPKILDLLPQADDRTPAEVVQRVGRVRQKLQRDLAEAATQASHVTLHDDGLPLSKALAAIQEQTGNKIVDARERDAAAAEPEIKVDFDKTPFWQALDQVLDQAELTIYPYGEEKEIRVVPRPEGQSPRAALAGYAGPFRFEPTRIIADRNLRDPTKQSLGVAVEITWEPRLSPVSLQAKMSEISAVDEKGNPIAADMREAEIEVPIESDAMAKEITIPLELPPREVKQIARLQGSFRALVPGKVQTFRFKDLAQAKNVEQRVGGVVVTLEEARKNSKALEVRVRVKFDEASGALQSHRGWIFDNEAYLEDPDGKKLVYGTFETVRQTKDEVGVAYLFRAQRPLSDYTFVYKTAGAVLSSPFKFELRNVKLP